MGGAERWYRALVERLAAAGHEVTYLTLRQWPRGSEPDVPGARIVPVGPRMALYRRGRRRVLPALVFGAGTLAHLLVHRRRYAVVHTASFPYLGLLAAGLARGRRGYGVVVDWHEVWTRQEWIAYLGPLAGRAGWLAQRACLRISQRSFCFSRLTAGRLRELGLRGEVRVLEGEYDGARERPTPRPAEPVVVFGGRHLPHKNVPALVAAIAQASVPGLRGELYGDGPDRANVLAAIDAAGVGDRVRAPGFVSEEELDVAMRRALCVALASEREGYGLLVVEAVARGVPVVVAEAPASAASELVEDGVNGFVARSPAPADMARAIERVAAAGPALRERTADWFAANADRLSVERSAEAVLDAYRVAPARAAPAPGVA